MRVHLLVFGAFHRQLGQLDLSFIGLLELLNESLLKRHSLLLLMSLLLLLVLICARAIVARRRVTLVDSLSRRLLRMQASDARHRSLAGLAPMRIRAL